MRLSRLARMQQESSLCQKGQTPSGTRDAAGATCVPIVADCGALLGQRQVRVDLGKPAQKACRRGPRGVSNLLPLTSTGLTHKSFSRPASNKQKISSNAVSPTIVEPIWLLIAWKHTLEFQFLNFQIACLPLSPGIAMLRDICPNMCSDLLQEGGAAGNAQTFLSIELRLCAAACVSLCPPSA